MALRGARVRPQVSTKRSQSPKFSTAKPLQPSSRASRAPSPQEILATRHSHNWALPVESPRPLSSPVRPHSHDSVRAARLRAMQATRPSSSQAFLQYGRPVSAMHDLGPAGGLAAQRPGTATDQYVRPGTSSGSSGHAEQTQAVEPNLEALRDVEPNLEALCDEGGADKPAWSTDDSGQHKRPRFAQLKSFSFLSAGSRQSKGNRWGEWQSEDSTLSQEERRRCTRRAELEDRFQSRVGRSRRTTMRGFRSSMASVGSTLLGLFTSEEDEDRPESPSQMARANDDEYTGRFRRAKRVSTWTEFKFTSGPLSYERKFYLYSRACENLGVEEAGLDDLDMLNTEPLAIRILRCFRLLEAVIAIEMKRIRVAEEEPFAPDLLNVVKSNEFEAVVGIILCFNMYCMGMDTYYSAEERPVWLLLADYLLVLFFIIELCMRVIAHSWVWLFEFENAFDVFLVVFTGVIPLLILAPAGVSVQFLRRFSIVRALRIVRLIRVVRLIPLFTELWTLVVGIVRSLSFLFWVGTIVGVVLFIFAVAFIDMVAKSDDFADDEEVQRLFGTLSAATFTLFQVMTLDSWAERARPMCMTSPISAVLWFVFIGVAALVLFNLCTAIVVKNAFDTRTQDEEAINLHKQQDYLYQFNELMDIFASADEDGSGELTRDEFTNILLDIKAVSHLKRLDIDPQELPDIFDVLDDGDGSVTAMEFVVGMIKLRGPAMSTDVLKATKMMSTAAGDARKIDRKISAKASRYLDAATQHLRRAHRNLVEVQQMTPLIFAQMDKIGSRHTLQYALEGLPKVPEPDLSKEPPEHLYVRTSTRGAPLRAPYLPPAYSYGYCEQKKENERSQLRQKLVNRGSADMDQRSVQSASEGVRSAQSGAYSDSTSSEDEPGPNVSHLYKTLNMLSIDVAKVSMRSVGRAKPKVQKSLLQVTAINGFHGSLMNKVHTSEDAAKASSISSGMEPFHHPNMVP